MARNSKGGKKYKRTKKFTSNQKNRELVLKQSDQKYGFLTENMGDLRFKVLCDDGKMRVGHVPGRFRGRYFFRKDDYVLVSIRSFQPGMCDLLYKYNPQEVLKLREKNLLVMIDQMEDNDLNLDIGIQDQLEEDSESESEAESESERPSNKESHTNESDSESDSDSDDEDMMKRINRLKLIQKENEEKEGRIIVNGYDITDL
jgi:translation initiation factor 1A